MHHTTLHQFTTSSESIARAIHILQNDPRSRDLLTLFARLKSPKRRNILLRMARYLTEGQHTRQERRHDPR